MIAATENQSETKPTNETLHLVLKKQWYDMIDSGEKKEEYRRRGTYWASRIWQRRRKLKRVVFRLGYQKNARKMEFEIESITWVYQNYKGKIVSWDFRALGAGVGDSVDSVDSTDSVECID